MIVDAIGFFASTISFILFLPQAASTWQNRESPRSLAALSPWTQWLILLNAASWWAYAILTGAFWVGAPGLVNAPLAVMTLYFIHRARRALNAAPVSLHPCGACDAGLEHERFIVAPPGYGSVMPCSDATRPHGVTVFTQDDIRALRAQRA